MKLLREYIRELLLIESDEVDADGYIKGEDGKFYNPQGRKQWELPYQFKNNRNLGRIRYYPDEDGTWNIKPPSPIPPKYDGVEGYVLHDAYGDTGYGNSIKYGANQTDAKLHSGQSAEMHEYPEDGSIVVAHPELWNNPSKSTWFADPDWVAYFNKAMQKIKGLSKYGTGGALVRKLQAFAMEADDPRGDYAEKLVGTEEWDKSKVYVKDIPRHKFVKNPNYDHNRASTGQFGHWEQTYEGSDELVWPPPEGINHDRALNAAGVNTHEVSGAWKKKSKLGQVGALVDSGREFVKQASAARAGAKLQGMSYEMFVYIGGFLHKQRGYHKVSLDAVPLLEFLDLFEEYQEAPKPAVEKEVDAVAAGKELAAKLGNGMFIVEFAKDFAKMWRKLKISPAEEIKAFLRYSRGNRDDGYPSVESLLKSTSNGYTIPDEAYAALARMYYT